MHRQIKTIYNNPLGEIRFSELGLVEIDFAQTRSVSLKYVLSGAENYLVEGQHFHLQAHQMLIFGQDRTYSAFTDANISNKGLCIDLDLDFMSYARKDLLGEEQLYNFAFEGAPLKFHIVNPETRNAMQRICSGMPDKEKLAYEEALNDLMQQYLLFEKEYKEKFEAIPASKDTIKKELFRKILIAQTFMHDNKSENLSLATIAKAAGLSRFYFQRLFKQVFDLSPSQYLEEIRMQEAIELLKGTKLSLSEIALHLGYHDLPYFSRRFKKYYGKAPSQMLKELK